MNEFENIKNRLANGEKIQVLFLKPIEELEAYPESGMKATIKSIRSEYSGDMYRIEFDYTEFDSYNFHFEKRNYYDKSGNPCLTAREANFYTQIESIYFDYSIPVSKYFEIL